MKILPAAGRRGSMGLAILSRADGSGSETAGKEEHMAKPFVGCMRSLFRFARSRDSLGVAAICSSVRIRALRAGGAPTRRLNARANATAVRLAGRLGVREFSFRYASPQHWLQVFRDYYGPTHKAFAALDVDGQSRLSADIVALLERLNRGGVHSLVVPSEYLEVVIEVR